MEPDEAVALVERFLTLVEERRLEDAEQMLAPDAVIEFPGGRRFGRLAELSGYSASRYRWVRKRRDAFDAGRLADGALLVLSRGTLHGENCHGKLFEGVRYLDRFVVRDGRIAEQLVFNDLAESGVLEAGR